MADQQYGLPDLRQVMAGRCLFEENPQPTTTEPFFIQTRNPSHQQHYFQDSIMAAAGEIMLPSSLVKFAHEHYRSNSSVTNGAPAASFFGVEMENNSRWPRQETLTLLDIRSRLNSRFKAANQKGPLWDEVSRIMSEEYGYQRSGKKCREKFENLYKYYKKTKEGKAGRQDGKNYRFFRQLEAIYGETSNQFASSSSATNTSPPNFLYQTINKDNQEDNNQSLSFSTTSEFETSSSEDINNNNHDDDLSAIAYMMNKQKGLGDDDKKNKKKWKGKVKKFVDMEMRKLFERQEVWMEKMLKTIEDRDQEKVCREEEWTKKEAARLDRIHEFCAKERARIEARDVALMEALETYSSKELELSSSLLQMANVASHRSDKKTRMHEVEASTWTEPELFSLIQIRTTMYSRFKENGAYSVEENWEEIAEKMSIFGYRRGVDECKEKWENMNMNFLNMAEEGNKKRNEDLITSNYFHQGETINPQSVSNSYVNSQIHGNCFQVPVNEGEHSWNKFGLKMFSKEKSQQH